MKSLMMPQNVEAEESIIGMVLLHGSSAIQRIIDAVDISPKMFWVTAHQKIFKEMLTLHHRGVQVSLLTLHDHLDTLGILDEVGGKEKLATILERTVTSVNIDALATLILEKYIRREMIRVGNEISELGHKPEEIPELLNKVEELAFNISQQRKTEGMIDIGESMANLFEELERRANGESDSAIQTGFYDFDELTGGFQRSNLIIVAARPGMGKTAFAMNVLENVAQNSGLPVAIFSLEMSELELTQRMLSPRADLPLGRIIKGQIKDAQEWEDIAKAMSSLSELPISLNDKAFTFDEIRSECRKFAMQKNGNIGLIVIDYVQLIDGDKGKHSSKGDNRNHELSHISRQLKLLARELNVPIVMLSQLSRGVEERNNKRPQLHDLRDSGALEQDANIVLALYRDEHYNPQESLQKGVAELIILKNRNGPTGMVQLVFDGEHTQFKNMKKM